MIIDTSALLAMILKESDSDRFISIMEKTRIRRLSAASYVEAAMNVDRKADQVGRAMLDTLIDDFLIKIEPVTVEQAHLAREAFVRFGKGRHQAGLNFGDCFSYALAKAHREPLLFKGTDFIHTDLESAD
jgi:ribonuclease VapC